jgi:fumarate reductase flavoprotein subunit
LTCIIYRTNSSVKQPFPARLRDQHSKDDPQMADIRDDDAAAFEAETDVLVIGAGAAGLVTALAAADRGLSVLVVERDAVPRGSTSLSAGLVPAPATRYQRALGIDDSVEAFAADIMRKAHDEPELGSVLRLASTIGPALEWLGERYGLPFSVVDNFVYPGHSAKRMHGLPTRSGAELMDRLREASESAGIDILTNTRAETLMRHGRRITGVIVARGDGRRERIGAGAVVLASNGFGGSRELVSRHIPEMAEALYFGHPGNQGDALEWGLALGAATRHLSGYQGHGSVAHPHGILITWATITEGGFQVNAAGRRFANEARGYSEAAASVIAEPGGVAWTVFDERIAGIAGQFEDFRNAIGLGAIVTASTIEELAERTRLPADALRETFTAVEAAKRDGSVDAFGRKWAGAAALAPPFKAVRVTGALFHTQGGLVVDDQTRVVGRDGSVIANLHAVGGAAAGVSGADASGYLSGNGLLTAIGYGFIAGRSVDPVHS